MYDSRTVLNGSDPAYDCAPVTPHDVNFLKADETPARSLYVGGAGSVVITNVRGVDVPFVGVPAGFVLPVHAKRVKATGTTATSIVALF
jgi:hypothetical protein